jgi:hypothetical protein
MGELKKIVPDLLSEPAAQAGLNFLPDGQGTVELRFTGAGEIEASFAAVLAGALGEPALTAHDGESSREAGAIHSQDFAQLSLGYFSGQGEGLQDGELRGAQAQGTEGGLVELR